MNKKKSDKLNKRMKKPGRSAELISIRNKVLIARYYYWTEIRRRRFDDALEILTKHEFFIGPQQIERMIRQDDGYYDELCSERPTMKKLSQQYPGFNWLLPKTGSQMKQQLDLSWMD